MKTALYEDLTEPFGDLQELLRRVELWGWIDDERLQYETLDEAIEYHLEGVDSIHELIAREPVRDFQGHVRMSMGDTTGDAEWVLEFLLERWDEDLGDPEGDSTKPSELMKKAALVFMETVRSEYKVWACEPIIRVIVPVKEWVEAHRPEWLEEEVAPSS